MSNHQRELFFGLIRIHVLVHASHEPIFGLAMMEELAHHGYRIGPGNSLPAPARLGAQRPAEVCPQECWRAQPTGLQDNLCWQKGLKQGQIEG